MEKKENVLDMSLTLDLPKPCLFLYSLFLYKKTFDSEKKRNYYARKSKSLV